ncbi:hypothetical protein FIBSPDRAFT_863017 [Athelia psychrophila]|uniref:Uncharacterized protein n=1 Tax=Athelia psychrophila TaxID=1759441 RepID=A0A166HPW6_9AGAM|nr:hypothetical protein FIBSPDRAFT_863017 [Fibularhizoctonia sp. CBS 109695]
MGLDIDWQLVNDADKCQNQSHGSTTGGGRNICEFSGVTSGHCRGSWAHGESLGCDVMAYASLSEIYGGGSSSGFMRIAKAMSAVKTSKGVPGNGADTHRWKEHICESRSGCPDHH